MLFFLISIVCKIIKISRSPLYTDVIYIEFKLNEMLTFDPETITMNFLAHAHLSGNNDQLLIGNFIGDSVKGRDFNHFPETIRQGIVLHRKIDSFTDSHPVFKNSLEIVRPAHGRYSGIVIDIFYDHFLAHHWSHFEDISLDDYANYVLRLLSECIDILPERTKRLLPFMVAQNWLLGYANFERLEQVFYGMDRRTQLASGMRHSVSTLKENYSRLEKDFFLFYPELQQFASNEIEKISFNSKVSGQSS